EPERAGTHGLDGGIQLAERGHQDHRHLGLDTLDLAQQLEPVSVGELEIEEREVGHVALHRHARLADAAHAGHGMALVLQCFHDEVADRVLILHHQDVDLAHRTPPWGSTGSSKVKVAPRPGSLCTASVPPWRLTISWVT